MADSCKHDRLLTFKDAETQEPVGLWACATCRAKFVPLDLAMEKDAERYRWLRDAPATWAPCPVREWLWKRPFGTGGTLDGVIDDAMAAVPAVGAA